VRPDRVPPDMTTKLNWNERWKPFGRELS